MSNETAIREDSLALMGAFAAIANIKTGIGTSRSKTEAGRINTRIRFLSRQELESLPYSDDLIRKALQLYPESAVNAWFHLSIADTKEGDNLPDLMLKYLSDLGDRQDQTEEEQNSDIFGAREAFLIASMSARQFGKAYILIGVDDGKDFSEPVDKNGIRAIRWLQVYDRWDLYPEDYGIHRRSPVYYRLYNHYATGSIDDARQTRTEGRGQKVSSLSAEYGQLIHKSRLLQFYGRRVFSRSKLTNHGWRDDGVSVIQSMFDAYNDWIQGIKAGAAMLADYDVFTLGMKGLAELIRKDQRGGTTAGQEAVMARALALDEGKSVVRGILYDPDVEETGSITRQYGGAENIMKNLEARWAASTDVPRFKLFGEMGGQGLVNSNQAGLAMRSEWAMLTQEWSVNNLLPPMQYLTKLAFLAKDSPSSGKIPESYEVIPRFNLVLTDTERMEYEKLAAERSQILVGIKAIAPKEVRTGYQGARFSGDIMLDPNADPEGENETPQEQQAEEQTGKETGSQQPEVPPGATEPRQDAQSELLTDRQWEDLSQVSAADFVRVANDVADS